jgi:hypothetical protein
MAYQLDRVGVLDQTRGRRDGARDANPDRALFAVRLLDIATSEATACTMAA